MKRILSIILSIFCVISLIGVNASADLSEYSILEIYNIPCTITNSQGQTLNFKEISDYSGDLKVLQKSSAVSGICSLYVEKSDGFTYYVSNRKTNIIFRIITESIIMTVEGKDIEKISVSRLDDKNEVKILGDNAKFVVHGGFAKRNIYIDCAGTINKEMLLTANKNDCEISGIKGKFGWREKEDYINYYSIDGSLKISKSGGKVKVENALIIPSKTAKRISSLRVKPIGKNKMALTWQKVKKAKSYIVYKYDFEKKSYKKVAVRNGNGANYYVEKNIDDLSKYQYKVSAKTKKDGKGKQIGKKSYAVSAVGKQNKKANASKIKINRTKKLVLKKGKTKKIKASVFAKDKKLISGSIRWYCSNKKIAKINRKTGKITAKKKGVCYIWAKAHNGKNSKRLKIKVK